MYPKINVNGKIKTNIFILIAHILYYVGYG
jgi:hypothetical protein